MSNLRQLADEMANLDLKDNPAGYLENMIRKNWEPGEASMKLADVNESDFSEDFVADLIAKNKKRMEPVVPALSPEDQQLQKEYDEYLKGYLERRKESGGKSEVMPKKFEEYLQRQHANEIEEVFRGGNVWHRELIFREKAEDLNKEKSGAAEGDLLLPENLTTEQLIVLMTTAVREGLKAICELDVDYYNHVEDGSDRIGARPIFVGDSTYITGKIVLK